VEKDPDDPLFESARRAFCAAASIVGITGGVNLYSTAARRLGLFSSYGGGLWPPFLCAHQRLEPEGGTRALRHAAARSSERADKVIILPLATVLLLGTGLAGWTAAYAASQLSAWWIPGAWPSPDRTTRFVRPASSWQACFFQGQRKAWSVADAHGSLRPWNSTRASHDTTVRMSCHGEKEGYYSNHDDARFIPRA
jgi:hypothetical protein